MAGRQQSILALVPRQHRSGECGRLSKRREGFVAEIGDWEANTIYTRRNFRSASQLREVLRKYPVNEWVGFQLYYPLTERELRACTGYELVQAMVGAFTEVVPAMNLCMQVRLESAEAEPRFKFRQSRSRDVQPHRASLDRRRLRALTAGGLRTAHGGAGEADGKLRYPTDGMHHAA